MKWMSSCDWNMSGLKGEEFYDQEYWNVFVSDGVFRLTLGGIGLNYRVNIGVTGSKKDIRRMCE